jgi:hypothetical protein
LIQSGGMDSCLVTQNVFWCLKGRGPLNFFNRRNFRVSIKAYRCIPFTPPPPPLWSFYSTFNTLIKYFNFRGARHNLNSYAQR